MAHIAPLLIAGVKIWRAPQTLRACEADDDRRRLVAGRQRQLGSAQPQTQFRAQYGSLRSRFLRDALGEDRIAQGTEITLQWLYSWPMAIRLRNRAVRLLLPYL